MIKQVFNVESYWRVIVYYNVDYTLFSIIEDELIRIGTKNTTINRVYNKMKSGKAKAVTISVPRFHISIVLFNIHDDIYDYADSIVHEAEHIKQAMLYNYRVNDEGEPPAYTIGFLVRKMFVVFKELVCSQCQ